MKFWKKTTRRKKSNEVKNEKMKGTYNAEITRCNTGKVKGMNRGDEEQSCKEDGVRGCIFGDTTHRLHLLPLKEYQKYTETEGK